MQLLLEKFVAGTWQAAAKLTIEIPQYGISSACVVEYLPEYALAYLDAKGEPALSANLPVSFHHQRFPHWPAFLLDILPSGFGRDLLVVQQKLPLPDGAHNDSALLAFGASNPVGNIRIAQAYHWLLMQLPQSNQGWQLEEMSRHDADFIDYAQTHGTLVAGTSTQGQAAKLWLTQKNDGLYYADILVADYEAVAHYLIKIPRNEHDANLLKHEFYWLQLAKKAGLNVHGEPFMAGGLLFIPRFDRIIKHQRVHRRAVESVFSLLDIAAHGQSLRHEDIIERWIQYADISWLGMDLLEYLQRDILGYCLRVEDNHGRNTAFFLGQQGIQLTPLFDFSPMFLANDPPARATLWRQFSPGNHVQWPRLFDAWLPETIGIENTQALRRQLAQWQPHLAETYTDFMTLDLDPRTSICHQRFQTVLEVLDALR